MKKIEIKNEQIVIKALRQGRMVEGRLALVKLPDGRCITEFRPYNRTAPKRRVDKLLRVLEHGWVRESSDRIKVYESIPKALGTPRMITVLERESKSAQEALIDREFDFDDMNLATLS